MKRHESVSMESLRRRDFSSHSAHSVHRQNKQDLQQSPVKKGRGLLRSHFGLWHNLCHMFLNSKTWTPAAGRESCQSITGLVTSAQWRAHFYFRSNSGLVFLGKNKNTNKNPKNTLGHA